jgi:hypothetical protein
MIYKCFQIESFFTNLTEPGGFIGPMFAVSHHFEQKLDPDPHFSDVPDSDRHKSEKLDTDRHQAMPNQNIIL